VELGEVDLKVLDRLAGQWDDAGLVAFAGEPDMPGRVQAEVLQPQAGDLPDAGGGVVEQDQQHPVPARFRGAAGEGGEHCSCLGFGEVLDRLSRAGWGS
jgi:hypothetical protein